MDNAILIALSRAVADKDARTAVLASRGLRTSIDTVVRVRGTVEVAETTTTRVTFAVDHWALLGTVLGQIPADRWEAVLTAGLTATDATVAASTKALVEALADRSGLGRISEVAPRTKATVLVEEVSL